jgi:ParB/RepB/Spo0J family partition protein
MRGKIKEDQTSSSMEIPISKIEIGNRYRKSVGDIDLLAENIKEYGLWHPITVADAAVEGRYYLIAGHRRLLAFEKLERDTIPACHIQIDDVVAGQYIENEFRKQLTNSERARIYSIVKPGFETKAKENIKEGQKRRRAKERGEDLTQANLPDLQTGQSRDRAAEAVGLGSGRTAEKATEVLKTGDQELIDKMDNESVDAAHKALKNVEKSGELTAPVSIIMNKRQKRREAGEELKPVIEDPEIRNKLFKLERALNDVGLSIRDGMNGNLSEGKRRQLRGRINKQVLPGLKVFVEKIL